MANSRNPKGKRILLGFEAPDDLCVAIQICLMQAQGAGPSVEAVAVGLSGGPDSCALAICSQVASRRLGLKLHLFHVHHGLHEQADAWMQATRELAELLALPLTTRRVLVDQHSGKGIEAAARRSRHAALSEMAKSHGVGCLLLAHHAQDQAETVLMRLLRGAGVTGLAAMKPVSSQHGVQVLRPWLETDRARLGLLVNEFSAHTGWQPVDDPSNRDVLLARGALRETVLPAIASRWPAWWRTLSRHAQQAAEVDELLGQFGEHLLSEVLSGDSSAEQTPTIDLSRWRGLTASQQALVLRVWFAQHGAPMPTDASLQELMRQLRGLHALGHDRAMRWRHGECVVTCVRGQVQLHVKLGGSWQ